LQYVSRTVNDVTHMSALALVSCGFHF